jgi:hypothetical protein
MSDDFLQCPYGAIIAEVKQAVEEFAYDRHSKITRSDVGQWNLDDDEYEKKSQLMNMRSRCSGIGKPISKRSL